MLEICEYSTFYVRERRTHEYHDYEAKVNDISLSQWREWDRRDTPEERQEGKVQILRQDAVTLQAGPQVCKEKFIHMKPIEVIHYFYIIS